MKDAIETIRCEAIWQADNENTELAYYLIDYALCLTLDDLSERLAALAAMCKENKDYTVFIEFHKDAEVT